MKPIDYLMSGGKCPRSRMSRTNNTPWMFICVFAPPDESILDHPREYFPIGCTAEDWKRCRYNKNREEVIT